MQKVNYCVLAALLILCLGCKTIENLGGAFADMDNQGPGGSSATAVVAESIQRGIPYLPSPFREAVLAAVAGLAAWAVARRNKMEGWQK